MGVLKLKYNSNNRSILKLKYIPTELIANRSTSFYVPEGMRFQNSFDIDFAKHNIKLKEGVRYHYCFENCFNCTFDVKKMNLDKISKDTTSIFKDNNNINIIGEIPSFKDYSLFFYNWYFSGKTYDEIKEISNKISNLEIIDGNLSAWQMFDTFVQDSDFLAFVDDVDDSWYFPLLDLSKWNVKKVSTDVGMFNDAYVFRLKFFKSQTQYNSNFISSNDKIPHFGIIENVDFANYIKSPWTYYSTRTPYFYALYAENLGINDNTNHTYYFNNSYIWGTKGHNVKLGQYTYDDETGEESYPTVDEITEDDIYNSFRYTIIEKSFDRVAAGYTKRCTLHFSKETFESITPEELVIINSKGYGVIRPA